MKLKRERQVVKAIKLCKYQYRIGCDISNEGIAVTYILQCKGFIKVLYVGVVNEKEFGRYLLSC